MLEEHLNALDSTTAIYHEFLLAFSATGKLVYGFVEGKDDPSFYRGAIDSLLPPDWSVRLFLCGDRERVLNVLDSMDWDRFQRSHICFFIDRDLSSFIGTALPEIDNLYITDGYSVENSICSSGTFERALEEVFNVAGLVESDWKLAHALHASNMRLFTDAVLPLMAQIVCWVRAGHRPRLDNINICGMFIVTDGAVALSPSLAQREDILRHSEETFGLPAINAADLDSALSEIGPRDHLIRGKYVMSFFLFSVSAIHAAIPVWCTRFKKAPSPRMSVGPKSAMMALAPRARIPESLRTFLSRTYGAYVSESGRRT